MIGFALANKKREGLTVRTNRGATQIVRATKYPVTGRGGKGYAILQRGSLEAVLPDEAEPVPSLEEFDEAGGQEWHDDPIESLPGGSRLRVGEPRAESGGFRHTASPATCETEL